jgi:hypothetical protein
METKQLSFEQGPIRPPNESRSLLLRVTRNCPWNQCLFCPVYKKQRFSLRSVDEIRKDIEIVRRLTDEIKALSWQMGFGGQVNDAVIGRIQGQARPADGYRNVAAWLYYGTGACFLQDADNLVMPTGDLVAVLTFLRQQLPDIKRVTTYARSRTIIRKSAEGLESGSDAVLKLMKKGVTAAQHAAAGRAMRQAGMQVSEYVMPGLGGQGLWREHALETAAVLNRINPHFIRLRSLRVPKRVPLYQKLCEGTFHMQTDDLLVEEIRLFIENLDGISSTVTSDHMMNLLPEVEGRLPEDKAAMLKVIEKYQALDPEQREIYRIGRRGGAFQSTDDLVRHPETYRKIRALAAEVRTAEGEAGIDRLVAELVDRYV